MSNVYILRPDNLSTEVIKCTGELHRQAKKGVVHGIAFIAYIEGHGYIANAAGTAFEDPTTTRGMLAALDDKLALKVQGSTL